MKPRLSLFAALTALLAAALACSLPLGGPGRPGPEIPVSEEAAQRAERKVEAALEQATQTRTFSLTVTQEEITSWVNLRATQYAQQTGEKIPLNDLQIYLSDNVVRLYGGYDDGGVSASALVTLTPSVTPSGQIAVQIASAQVGPVALSADQLQSINQAIQSNLDALMTRLEGRYQIVSLLISEGALTASVQVLP